jgi:hypothetical protein
MVSISDANLLAALSRIQEIRAALVDYLPDEPVLMGGGDYDTRCYHNAVLSLTQCMEWMLLQQGFRETATKLPPEEHPGTIPFSGR